MPEGDLSRGESKPQPPTPQQLGSVRDLIRELAPSPEEVTKNIRQGRHIPGTRTHAFADRDRFFQLIVTSHAHHADPTDPKKLGFVNIMEFDSEAKETLLSQRQFHLEIEGDASDDNNLRLRENTTTTPFDQGAYHRSNIAFFAFGIDDGFMSSRFYRDAIATSESDLIGEALNAAGANADQAQDLIETLLLARARGTVVE